MDTTSQLPADGQLVVFARDGVDEAFIEIERRHGAAIVNVVAAQSGRGAKKRSRRALDVFHDAILAVEPPADTDDAVKALRPRAAAVLTGGTYGPEPGDDLDDANVRVELGRLAHAFASLSESWQTALWHRYVELDSVTEIAHLLGTSPDHAVTTVAEGANALTQRYTDRVERVRADGDDIEVLALADDLDSILPAAIVPALTTLTVEAYRAAVAQPTAVVAASSPAAAAPVPAVSPEGAGEESDPSDRRRKILVFFAVIVLLGAAVGAVIALRDNQSGSGSTAQVDDPPSTATEDPSNTQSVDDDATSTSTAGPSTTELELRPQVESLTNNLQFVFMDRGIPIELSGDPIDFQVALASPGPVFAGGTGTIDVAIMNESDAPIRPTFAVRTPRGVSVETIVDGAAGCIDPADNSVTCSLTVPALETKTLALRFELTRSTVGELIVASNVGDDELTLDITATPRLVHSSVGRGDILTIGNTLMTCLSSDATCDDAQAGEGDIVNRWDIPTEFIGGVEALGWQNSSTATLDLGEADVAAAFLYWSGDLSQRDVEVPDDGSNATVSIIVPGAELPADLNADRLRLGDIDATQYLGTVDVTDIVREAGSGDYIVGNVQSVEVQGSYAGWSLVVVTNDPALPRRELVVTNPFAWFAPDEKYGVELPVPVGAGQVGTLDVVAFEGERGFFPERLALNDVELGDGASFDSSIIGERDPAFENNFGIDIDQYELAIDSPDGKLTFSATSDQDGIRLAVLGLVVDLE